MLNANLHLRYSWYYNNIMYVIRKTTLKGQKLNSAYTQRKYQDKGKTPKTQKQRLKRKYGANTGINIPMLYLMFDIMPAVLTIMAVINVCMCMYQVSLKYGWYGTQIMFNRDNADKGNTRYVCDNTKRISNNINKHIRLNGNTIIDNIKHILGTILCGKIWDNGMTKFLHRGVRTGRNGFLLYLKVWIICYVYGKKNRGVLN